MNSCSCKDWKAVGNLFHEAIGMIHIKYCPWCRSELYQREVPYIPQEPVSSFSELLDPNASRTEQPKGITVDDMMKEPPSEPKTA